MLQRLGWYINIGAHDVADTPVLRQSNEHDLMMTVAHIAVLLFTSLMRPVHLGDRGCALTDRGRVLMLKHMLTLNFYTFLYFFLVPIFMIVYL